MNVEASILARMTNVRQIVLLGNILPIWDDPLWLVEQLAMIDLISRGRLVSGWVRGTGRESVAHNIPPHYYTGALPGGARVRREGLDDPGPSAGKANIPFRRESLGAPVSKAPSAHLAAVW